MNSEFLVLILKHFYSFFPCWSNIFCFVSFVNFSQTTTEVVMEDTEGTETEGTTIVVDTGATVTGTDTGV